MPENVWKKCLNSNANYTVVARMAFIKADSECPRGTAVISISDYEIILAHRRFQKELQN